MKNKIEKKPKKNNLNTLITEFTPAIVVSFLTIAAGSAFGVLTGLGAQAGIISMVVASLFGWLFGGIPVKASGPTGPTASVMLAAVLALQAAGINISAVFLILALAGIILFILGFFPLEKLISLIPNIATAVFINGVALIIINSQIKKVIGYHLESSPSKWWDTGLAIGSLVFLIIWPKVSGNLQMSKLGKLLSGSLMVMVIGGVLNVLFGSPAEGIMVESELFSGGIPLQLELLSEIPLEILLVSSIKIAFIIFFVTVVSARALMPKDANYKAELRNIGIANIAVAAFGGLASSIGFIRSKILQNNGSTSKLSGIFTALLVLALLLLAKPILMQIPVSVFIGILINAAWNSIDWQFLKDFRNAPKQHFIGFAIVSLGSIAMLWFDQATVVLVASVLWYALMRIPGLSSQCVDLEQCPIASQEMKM